MLYSSLPQGQPVSRPDLRHLTPLLQAPGYNLSGRYGTCMRSTRRSGSSSTTLLFNQTHTSAGKNHYGRSLYQALAMVWFCTSESCHDNSIAAPCVTCRSNHISNSRLLVCHVQCSCPKGCTFARQPKAKFQTTLHKKPGMFILAKSCFECIGCLHKCKADICTNDSIITKPTAFLMSEI